MNRQVLRGVVRVVGEKRPPPWPVGFVAFAPVQRHAANDDATVGDPSRVLAPSAETTVIPNGLHRIQLGKGLQAHVETRLVSSPARPRRSRSSTSLPRRLGGWWGATARHSRRQACSPPLSVMVDCCCVQGTPGVVPFVPFVPVRQRHRLSADYDKGSALDQNRLMLGPP